jgi:hypothetical protein
MMIRHLIVSAAMATEDPIALEHRTSGFVWSTMRVGLTIAALRGEGTVTNGIWAAISESDDAAAEAI